MSRRPRRSGIQFIENEKDRNLTYFKRRSGIYKSVADLSTLTGAKIAFAAEAESGKKSAFGTPSATTVIDSSILEHNPHIDEEENAKITHMQAEIFRIKEDKGVKDKRERECITLIKEIQNNPGRDKLVSRDVEDLGVDELSELFQGLTPVYEDINDQANPNKQLEVSSQSGPFLPPSTSLWHSKINMPSRHLPWVLFDQTTVPLAQAPLPLPNEDHQYNYHFSQAQSPLPSSERCLLNNELQPLPPSMEQPPLLHLQDELPLSQMAPPHPNHSYNNSFNFDSVAPTQNNANSHNFATDQHSFDYQWPPVSPCSELYYDPNSHALCAYYGLAEDYGDDEPVPYGLYAQHDDDWLTMNLFGSPTSGEGSGDGA